MHTSCDLVARRNAEPILVLWRPTTARTMLQIRRTKEGGAAPVDEEHAGRGWKFARIKAVNGVGGDGEL